MSARLLLALALGLAALPARAANSGTNGAQFLTIEQGARGLGMGGAYTAVVDDSGGLWWNPAGLSRVESNEATFSHTSYLENVTTEYVGFARPWEAARGTIGASFLYLSIPGVDGYDINGNPTGSLNAGGYVGTVSYATAFTPNLSAGLTAKYLHEKLDTDSGSGMAFDLGGQYRDGNYGAGLVIQNYGKAFKIGSASDPLPRDIRGGVFYVPTPKLTLSLDEEKPNNELLRLHLGGEWKVQEGVHLRAGFQQTPNSGSAAGFTVGFGVAGAFGGKQAVAGGTADERSSGVSVAAPFWERLSGNSADLKTAVKEGAMVVGIDYAFVSNGDLTDVHRLTLNVRF